jgi:hypothetical protein
VSILSDLMATKAEDMDDDKIKQIIEVLRAQRKNFNAEEATKASKPKPTAIEKAKAAKQDPKTLDLLDLGL